MGNVPFCFHLFLEGIEKSALRTAIISTGSIIHLIIFVMFVFPVLFAWTIPGFYCTENTIDSRTIQILGQNLFDW